MVPAITLHAQNPLAIGDLPLEKDPSLNKTILEASRRGDLETVEAIMKLGADYKNARGEGDWAPLHMAAIEGHDQVVELLLANGADANVRDLENSTPLHYAANKSHLNTTEILLRYGADVNAKDDEGETPLRLSQAMQLNEWEAEAGLLRAAGGDAD